MQNDKIHSGYGQLFQGTGQEIPDKVIAEKIYVCERHFPKTYIEYTSE